MIDLSIEGKITIFKILVISKILHLGLITSAPAFIIRQLNTIKKNYAAKKKTRNKTLYEIPKNWVFLTLLAPIPQNGQTHSNNLSAICRRIV